jgi:iron uptake system component EfeO
MGTLKKWKRGAVAPAILIVLAGLLLLGPSGCGSSASSDDASPKLQAALSDYRDYLRENAAELSRRLQAMSKVIERELGEEPVPAAESVYPGTRVPYGHIDPFVQLFPPLQRGIDGLEEEVPPDEYGGFHRIEKQFYWQKVTGEMEPIAKQLGADVEAVRERIDSADLQPAQLVIGIRKTIDEIAENVFAGDAARWSHLDLLDAGAKTEGAEAAFEAVKPLLEEEDPELTRRIQAQLRKALETVGEYGTLARDGDPSEPLRAGTSFVVYDQVTQDKRWEIAAPFKELSDLLAQAEEALGDS